MTRLDKTLVARGLAASRTAAARSIQAGDVMVNDQPVLKPSSPVSEGDIIRVMTQGPQYASRAGHKLAGALDIFRSIQIAHARCLDAGASTGGFTDVLLRRAAREVIAVDVGHGQIVDRLRSDKRVDIREGLNIRYLTLEDIGTPVDLVVSDLSFISLRLVLQPLADVSRPGADLVLMIKPQFEIGRERLPKTGVVTDPGQRQEAVLGVIKTAVTLGLVPRAVVASPLPGQDGNKEFFFWATKDSSPDVDAHDVPTSIHIERWLAAQAVPWADEVR